MAQALPDGLENRGKKEPRRDIKGATATYALKTAIRHTNVFVFSNKCDSIVQGNSKDKNGLDQCSITNAPRAPVPILFDGGKTLTLDEKEPGDIWKYPPLFTYEYNGDYGDDYEGSDYPCSCAHSDRRMSDNVDVQACNCWFNCA